MFLVISFAALIAWNRRMAVKALLCSVKPLFPGSNPKTLGPLVLVAAGSSQRSAISSRVI